MLINMYCPRCDRGYTGKDEEKVLATVRRHVELQHPDHDPDWWKTDGE